MGVEAPEEVAVTAKPATASDLAVAGRNAVKLGFSLFATWTVAALITIKLPRYLGPERFGAFNFSENFAAAFFTAIELGVDTYITKETATRPKHASEFFAGLLVARLFASTLLFTAMATTLAVTHRSSELQLTVFVFGLAQLATISNNSFAAMLQASTRVDRLAVANVAAKVVWGIGLACAIFFGASLPFLAVPLLVSELLKTMMLAPETVRILKLHMRIDRKATQAVLLASVPYFLNTGAVNIGGRLNVTVLEFVTPDKNEVGWFSAAQRLASLALLLAPLIVWVLIPLLARAKERSKDEVYAIGRRAIEGLLVAIIPVTLVISLGSSLWVRLAFGGKYDEAAAALSLFSIDFVLIYLGMTLSILLFMVDRNWSVTLISVASIPVRPVLVAILAVPCAKWLGPGGGAVGASLAELGAMIAMVAAFFYVIGREAVDRRSSLAIGKSIAIANGVAVMDRLLRPIGDIRLVIDVVVYAGLALLTGAVRIGEALQLVRIARGRGKLPAEPPP
jgi:O-antigen/teichoic acid export membrane protein